MATLKYKEPSPYKSTASGPPKEDIKYLRYLENLKAETSTHGSFGFALFGVGRAGTIHLDFLVKCSKINLLYVVDDDCSKWNKLKHYWNLPSTTFLTSKDADKVYKDPQVRAVIVASPTFTHENIIINALSNNKAVLCEKPIAETYEDSKKCYDLSKKVNQPLLSAFNRRFDPAYDSVKNRVRNGEVGQVLTVKVCSRDSPLPSLDYLKISGGIFHDCAVHDIDQIISILGEYPSRVSVIAKANIPEIAAINDYDTVAIILSFDSGALGMIDLSRHCTYGYDQRLEVFGQKGMIRAENQSPLHSIETYMHNNVKKSPIDYSFPSRYDTGYIFEMEHFIRVLEGKEELSIHSNDTLAVTKIASACEESAKSGKAVDLKWSKDELVL